MSRNRNELENIDGVEDDFGDFGGFEAADPIIDLPSTQAQPSESPWVLYGAGNASGRPDLLCAQNRFPTYLDPSDISGAYGASHGLNNNNIPPQLPDDLFSTINVNQARIAENILDGTLNAAAVPDFHPNIGLANGHLPDIGLGINEGHLFNLLEDAHPPLQADQNIEALPPQALAQAPPEAVNILLAEEAGQRSGSMEVDAAQPEVDVPPTNRTVEGPENDGDNLPNILRQQIDSLTERNRSLEDELASCQEQLAAQLSRFEEIQSQFSQDLENIRQAGHDALSLVIEQYKEQSRTIVLEQQEMAQRNLVEVSNTQMKLFQDMLQTERDLNEQQREEDKRELGRSIETALEESCQKLKERCELFLAEEQEKHRNEIAKAVEEKSQESSESIKQAMDAQYEKLKAGLEKIMVECSEKLAEDKKFQDAAIQSYREEQQKIAQEQMSNLVLEERERSRTALREASEKSRLDMQMYIQEQRQSDSRVRQRHLLSLDLFLESSRQQIALLLQSEKPEATKSSDVKNNEDSENM
ncbi:hypothetical protein Btru_072759 [Bulinus truncatus]|nr:hypothetical protein Btru_072759 [Bulinus truncatus]